MTRQTRAGAGPQNPYAQQQLAFPPVSSPMYPQPRMPMAPDTYYTMPPSSAPPSMQLAPQQQLPTTSFDSYPTAAPSVELPHSHRPSSGAWTIRDDQTLLAARTAGDNWSKIRDQHFPNKTPNACRKRHERLAERREADDWDNRKLQKLAQEYMNMRKEIWSGLAARTGEKWNIVEQKCMSNGLKNLQSAARAASRHERLQSQSAAGGPLTGYDDDGGGISGIGLTSVDELDASYSSPDPSSSGSSNSASSSDASAGYYHHPHHHPQDYPHHHHHHHQHSSLRSHHPNAHMQALGGGPYLSAYDLPPSGGGYHGPPAHHRYSSSVSSTNSAGQAYVGPGSSSDGSPPYMRTQRLPSADMGIGAIINRPGRGGGL